MLRVGLTGGIACGKSTVAAMMHELGCHILEADRLAHRLIEPGQPAYEEVLREFGREILSADDYVDRKRLGSIVFGDPARLARLNAIIHPLVLAEEDREFARLAKEDPRGVAVVVAALLIEAGFHMRLDRLIVVWCTPEQQIERLTSGMKGQGRGLTPEAAKLRVAAQLDVNEKRRLADDDIDCSGTLEETRRQVELLVQKLKRLAGAPVT
jgi:dephospho-CoA kinase